MATAAAGVERASGADGLAGLVNNAGAGSPRPMEVISLDQAKPDYADTFGGAIERIAADHHRQGGPREVTARAVVLAMIAPRPRTGYPAGGRSKQLTRFARILPGRVLDHLFLRMVGLSTTFGTAGGR